MVFFLDLETTGLDVLHDEVLELALTADPSGAQFATTVLPKRLPEGLGVHGIGQDELLSGVPFACAFQRMIGFLQDVVNDSLFNAGASMEGIARSDASCMMSRFSKHRLSSPSILLVGHNGVKFDFPMLVSECRRHDCDLLLLAEFYFCDTLPLARAFSATIGDACARLQCLARCCRCGAGRQHRALEDTAVLRAVVQHCADYSGVSVRTLLGCLVRRFDAQATLAARRALD
jgi:DNA polymerase III epsilon subunit-like protein